MEAPVIIRSGQSSSSRRSSSFSASPGSRKGSHREQDFASGVTICSAANGLMVRRRPTGEQMQASPTTRSAIPTEHEFISRPLLQSTEIQASCSGHVASRHPRTDSAGVVSQVCSTIMTLQPRKRSFAHTLRRSVQRSIRPFVPTPIRHSGLRQLGRYCRTRVLAKRQRWQDVCQLGTNTEPREYIGSSARFGLLQGVPRKKLWKRQ